MTALVLYLALFAIPVVSIVAYKFLSRYFSAFLDLKAKEQDLNQKYYAIREMQDFIHLHGGETYIKRLQETQNMEEAIVPFGQRKYDTKEILRIFVKEKDKE